MRKIIVLSFLTLDGVMQAPGGPEEDASGAFPFGGWAAPYDNGADTDADEMMTRQLRPADLLLGRRTFDIFEAYWPGHSEFWPTVNDVTKYVVSTSRQHSDWSNSIFLKDVEAIKALKDSDGGDLQVHGSGNLAQTLFRHDLVDELWLKFYPVTLGTGKRLFEGGTIPAAFTLTESLVARNGVIFANYSRAGEVRTGTING